MRSKMKKKKQNENVEQSRFTIKDNEMTLEKVVKKNFSQLNDKRFYFCCGIVSLLFSHPYLNEINRFKKDKKGRVEYWFLKEKDILKKLEKEALLNHRLCMLQTVYDQLPQFRDIMTNKRMINNIENINVSMNTRNMY